MIKREIKRILVVGGTIAIIDIITCTLPVTLNLDTAISKDTSFSTGALFSYFVNYLYTLNQDQSEISHFLCFITLHLTTLVDNVTTNKTVLNQLGRDTTEIGIPFILATGLSAKIIFLGMKNAIFTSARTIGK